MPEHGRIPLTLAHSPDPDDAFMWWPLAGRDKAGPAIDTGPFDFTLCMDDIETLNREAQRGTHDITAISIACWPSVRSDYVLTSCGASVGDGYGPKLVARPGTTLEDIRARRPVIAVPGARTTALATCRLLLGDTMRWEAVPFDEIDAAVLDGRFEAGVVIHEGQLTCTDCGLEVLVDLGAWWQQTRGLLLPLGGNVVRRDLDARHGPATIGRLAGVLRDSVAWAMDHRETSLDWALQFGRGISRDQADRFVEMYVNRWTLDFGDDGRRAVEQFLDEGHRAGVLDDPGTVDFAQPVDSTVEKGMAT